MRYAIPSLIALILVQILKCVWDSIRNRTFSTRMLLSSGGMPSSHSAICTALGTYIALTEGFHSPFFGVALVLSTIVMYDAIGVRQETGRQSVMLNELIDVFAEHGRPLNFKRKLNTLTGHTARQVVVGAFIGVVIGGCCVILPLVIYGYDIMAIWEYILHKFRPLN